MRGRWTQEILHAYEFPVCPQFFCGSAGDNLASYMLRHLNILGVDVLPEHNRW